MRHCGLNGALSEMTAMHDKDCVNTGALSSFLFWSLMEKQFWIVPLCDLVCNNPTFHKTNYLFP